MRYDLKFYILLLLTVKLMVEEFGNVVYFPCWARPTSFVKNRNPSECCHQNIRCLDDIVLMLWWNTGTCRTMVRGLRGMLYWGDTIQRFIRSAVAVFFVAILNPSAYSSFTAPSVCPINFPFQLSPTAQWPIVTKSLFTTMPLGEKESYEPQNFDVCIGLS